MQGVYFNEVSIMYGANVLNCCTATLNIVTKLATAAGRLLVST